MSRLEELETARLKAGESALYWDGIRRALRDICEPIEDECERYRLLLWTRLYGHRHKNERWLRLEPSIPDDHPGRSTQTSKEVAEIVDALRGGHREAFKDYRKAQDMARHWDTQIRALDAAIDSEKKVPLGRARKAPKDKRGSSVQPDIFKKGGE